MHIDTVISHTSKNGDFFITTCHFLLSQAVLYSDHSGMTFLMLKSSSSLITHVKGLAMFGVQYRDPGMSFCHGKFRAKEWISHGTNAKYRWNSAKAMGLFSSGLVKVVLFHLSERVLLVILVFLLGLVLNMRVAKSVIGEAVLKLKGSKNTTVRLLSFCKDKRHLLFISILPQNSSQWPEVHNTLW